MMKKLLFIICVLVSLATAVISVSAYSDSNSTVKPYSTESGPGGVTRVELHDNRQRVWWYALPYTNGSYTFSGGITVTLSNGRTLFYPVSKDGYAGGSVSSSIRVPGKVRKATLGGIAYGSGGIQIALPNSETNSFSGGGSGMSLPNIIVTEIK